MLDASALRGEALLVLPDDVSEDIMYRAFDLTTKKRLQGEKDRLDTVHSRPFILIDRVAQTMKK